MSELVMLVCTTSVPSYPGPAPEPPVSVQRPDEAEHRQEAEQHTEDGDGYAVDLKALAHVRLNLPGRSAGGVSAGRVFR